LRVVPFTPSRHPGDLDLFGSPVVEVLQAIRPLLVALSAL
jgi:hypothetical protein